MTRIKVVYYAFRIILFLACFALFIWHAYGVFQQFIDGKTTFVMSQQRYAELSPPAVIICPGNKVLEKNLDPLNMSTDAFFEEAYIKLNEDFFIEVEGHEPKLTVGENVIAGRGTFRVTELHLLTKPAICYSISSKDIKLNATFGELKVIVSFDENDVVARKSKPSYSPMFRLGVK